MLNNSHDYGLVFLIVTLIEIVISMFFVELIVCDHCTVHKTLRIFSKLNFKTLLFVF